MAQRAAATRNRNSNEVPVLAWPGLLLRKMLRSNKSLTSLWRGLAAWARRQADDFTSIAFQIAGATLPWRSSQEVFGRRNVNPRILSSRISPPAAPVVAARSDSQGSVSILG
jgi:hypothetical protein